MLNKNLDLNQNFYEKDVEKLATRDGFGEGLLAAGKKNSSVYALSADLTQSVRAHKFAEEFAERFVQTGISEQNMAGMAAGLSFEGKIPFITSYGTFSPGRNWEQIRVSICYSNANVKIIGSHTGLSASRDGPTAQALEDIALTRVLPNMTVIDPIDYHQAYDATIAAAKHKGPVYIRLIREETPVITTKSTTFEIGKSLVLKEGTDLSVFTTGAITTEVLRAAKTLKNKHKIDCEVIAFPTIKPLDETAIIKSVRKTKKAVSVEEHQVFSGFGSAIAEVLSQQRPTKLEIIGVKDTFAESGSYDKLKHKYGLSAEVLTEKVLNYMRIKK